MKYSFFCLLSILLLIELTSCKTAQPARPMESYSTVNETPLISNVNIPVRINVKDIEKVINTKLNGVIYEDNNLKDDGLAIKATKSQPIKISVDGLQFNYRVPIKLWIKKDVTLTNVEAEGEIALNFKTNFNIKDDWSIDTKTEVVGYDWTKSPVLKLGFADLPIKYIANQVLERSKSIITKSIDDQFKSQFDLKVSIRDAWNLMQQPVEISKDYHLWVKLTPQSVSMTPLKNTNGVLESTINVQTVSDVSLGEQPKFRANTGLPNFKYGTQSTDEFLVNISTDVPFHEAERIAKQFILGETFTSGSKKVTVQDIQLFGQGDKLVVNTKMTGSYNGSIYLTGKPVFNVAKNAIEMEDVDFELETKSFLMKSAKWLFNKLIIKKVKESLVFPLDENVKSLKETIQKQLNNYQLSNNVQLNGSINDLKVDKILITQESIIVQIISNGKLSINVNGLE